VGSVCIVDRLLRVWAELERCSNFDCIIPEVATQREHRDGNERREHVLNAAMEAIAEVGVDKLRMTDIAKKAGMTPGHILYYFGRKDRILVETLHWSETELERRRAEALAGIPDPHGKLQQFIVLYLPTGRDDMRWRLWTQVWAHPQRDPETLAELERSFETWRRDLAGILEAGDMTSDAATVATLICYALDGISVDYLTGSGPETAEAARALALDAATRLIGA
jgi:AcrR family transcriptional regulator